MEPAAQVVFLHRDNFLLKPRVERAQLVIRLLDELNVAIGQRRDNLGCGLQSGGEQFGVSVTDRVMPCAFIIVSA